MRPSFRWCMFWETGPCPICAEGSRVERLSNSDALEVECPRHGMVWITGRLFKNLRSKPT
jgi:hypothetical protein